MKTTTETTITGKETILKDTMQVAYEVEVERTNTWASITLYMMIGKTKHRIDYIFKSIADTFAENLEDALKEATEKWQIEIQLKKVA